MIHRRFWMCYVAEAEYPRRKHEDKGVAVAECARLARLTGKPVFLLESMNVVEIEPPKPIEPDVKWSIPTSDG